MIAAMKPIPYLLTTLLAILSSAVIGHADSFPVAPGIENDVTEAPTFLIEGGGPSEVILPLKSSEAEVMIEGPIATVLLRQTYQNTSDKTIHASYVFPGSTRAAVHDLVFEVGDRRIRADIQERAEARETFQTAQSEGKRAALLEQHRPNVFQMRVANILPGSTVAVELTYTETLERIGSIQRWVLPTVVGPRYSENPDHPDGGDRWVASPFLMPDSPVNRQPPEFRFHATVSQPLPISRIGSPSHSLEVTYPSPESAIIALRPGNDRIDNRDIILEFSIAGDQPQAGLLVSNPETSPDGTGTFLLTLEPPARAPSNLQIPREYIFILDVSGSMHGFPLEIARQVMRDLVADLRPGERFNAIAFAGGHSVFASDGFAEVSATSVPALMQWIDGHHGSGGTRLVPALDAALAMPRSEGFARSMILLTDGYVTVESEAFEQIASRRGDANCFAIGIGSSVNRHLIEGIARAGGGEPVIVTDPAFAAESTTAFLEKIRNPVLTDIEITFEGWSPDSIIPIQQPDIFLHRPIEILGRFQERPEGTVIVRGRQGNSAFEQVIPVPDQPDERPGLVLLWARRMIQQIEDQSAFFQKGDARESVLALALKYRLLTRYTSFVAVEETIVNPGGQGNTVEQPAPLPKGVSPLALGGGIPGTPEPGSTWLLLLTALGLAACRILARPERQGLQPGS